MQISVDIKTSRHLALNGRRFFIKTNRFLKALCAKRLGTREDVDSFEPVSFTLAIVTEDDVEAWSPMNLAAQISKIIYFKSVEDHQGILTLVEMVMRSFL